ncbi:MAG: hypothetical protein ACU84H_07020 [Gammaproteobacteria bacterium]
MTTVGLFMMIVSNSAVLSLMVYCFYRVFRAPGAENHEHGMLDIDTRDAEDGSSH